MVYRHIFYSAVFGLNLGLLTGWFANDVPIIPVMAVAGAIMLTVMLSVFNDDTAFRDAPPLRQRKGVIRAYRYARVSYDGHLFPLNFYDFLQQINQAPHGPHWDGQSGFYSLKTRYHTVRHGRNVYLCGVSNWGKVIEHRFGYRTEWQRIDWVLIKNPDLAEEVARRGFNVVSKIPKGWRWQRRLNPNRF